MIFVTIIFVLAIEVSSHHPIHYGLVRIFDTLLGVSFAIMVTSYFWPSYASKAVERNFQEYFAEVDGLFLIFTQAFIGEKLSLEDKKRNLKNLDAIYVRLKENIAFLEYEFDEQVNFQEQANYLLLKLSHLYSFLYTLACLATEDISLIPTGELCQLLDVFIHKANKSTPLELSEECHKIFIYLQNTSIKTEQEQKRVVGAFVQSIYSIMNALQSARYASQAFFEKGSVKSQ